MGPSRVNRGAAKRVSHAFGLPVELWLLTATCRAGLAVTAESFGHPDWPGLATHASDRAEDRARRALWLRHFRRLPAAVLPEPGALALPAEPEPIQLGRVQWPPPPQLTARVVVITLRAPGAPQRTGDRAAA